MKFMEFENGVEAGRRSVKINSESNWTLIDYEQELKEEVFKDYSFEGSTAEERRVYGAGYMSGVRDALDDLNQTEKS